MTGDACLRLKRLLLSRWLSAPPAVPRLRLDSTVSTITASFDYAPPTPYNSGDCFELQARTQTCRTCWTGKHARETYAVAQLYPTQPELVKALGDALDWYTFYRGPDRVHVVDRLPRASLFGSSAPFSCSLTRSPSGARVPRARQGVQLQGRQRVDGGAGGVHEAAPRRLRRHGVPCCFALW